MCKIKGKKIKRNFLSFSSLVPHIFVHTTKTIGILQTFGINDDKTTVTAQGKGWAKRRKWEEWFSNTPFITISLNQGEVNHSELRYNSHTEHRKINKS